MCLELGFPSSQLPTEKMPARASEGAREPSRAGIFSVGRVSERAASWRGRIENKLQPNSTLFI